MAQSQNHVSLSLLRFAALFVWMSVCMAVYVCMDVCWSAYLATNFMEKEEIENEKEEKGWEEDKEKEEEKEGERRIFQSS